MLTLANAAVRLNRTIHEAEEAMDQALERHAALLHSATLALGTKANIDPVRSQTTLMQIQKALGELTNARSNTLRVHGELLKFAKELGMTEEEDCPEWQKTSGMSNQRTA